MKRLIQLIWAKKKLGLAIIALFLIFIIFSIHIISGVHKNIEKMADYAGETVEYFPAYPAVNTSGKDPELIKRGEYLSKAGDCIACHTNSAAKEKSKPFAGGLAMYTPFGTIYSPNITPDKKTGIGNWTEEQFIKAMREGIAPSGHYYYPAFPYLYFNKISTDDLKALKAYLDSIPAVEQANRENDMVFPFNIRFLQFGWRMLFFHPDNSGVFTKDPQQSEVWNRGAYLTESLGHCAMCHSPSYHILDENLPLGAPIRKYDLTGSKIQGFLAPNITKVNLDSTSIDEVIDVFTQDKLIGGGHIEGPMLEVNHNSLRYLSHDDLVAIATYLKAVRSETPPKPKVGPGGVGKAMYDMYCAGCHAAGAGGAPKYGDATTWESVLKEPLDKIYLNAIQGKGGMPAKGTCLSCSDDEIKQSVDYMLASVKGRKVIPKEKKLTLEDGKRIYSANCAVCHDSGFKNAPKPGDKVTWQPIVDAGFLPAYQNVLTGQNGHPVNGACPNCTDAEIKAAVKYMLTESSTGKDFSLW